MNAELTNTANEDGRPELLAALIDDPQANARARDAVAVEDDSGADSGPLARMVAEFGAEIPPAVCADVLAWMAEQGLLVGAAKRPSGGTEEAKWRPLASKLLKIMQYIKDRQGSPVVIYAALAAWDCELFDDINGHLSQQDFANTIIVRHEITRDAAGRETRNAIHLTKAAVNNALKDAQKFFGCPPRADQRGEEACQNMREKRIGQLAKPA